MNFFHMLTMEQKFIIETLKDKTCYCMFYGKVCVMDFKSAVVALSEDKILISEASFSIAAITEFQIGYGEHEVQIVLKFETQTLEIRASR